MAKKRDSAIIYGIFYKGVQALPPEMKAEAYDAYCEYAIYGNVYTGDNLAIKALLSMISGKIEEANENYEAKKNRMDEINKSKKSDNARHRTTSHDIVRHRTTSHDIVRQRNDIDPVTVSVSVTDSVSVSDSDSEPPTVVKTRECNYQEVVDAYNATCVSLPKVQTISGERKKAIKARLRTHSLGDLQRAFELAEASDFLRGGNNRNWTANFDWIIKDRNLAKVLDGNYSNRARSGTTGGYVDAIQHRFDPINEWLEKGEE